MQSSRPASLQLSVLPGRVRLMRDAALDELKQNPRRDDGLNHVRTSAVDLGRWLVDHLGDERVATARALRTQHKDDWDECWVTRARIKEDVSRRLEKADDAALRAAALCVVLWPEDPYSDFDDILNRATRRHLGWTAEQASVLWRLAAADQKRGFQWVKCIKSALASLKGLEEPELRKLALDRLTFEGIATGAVTLPSRKTPWPRRA